MFSNNFNPLVQIYGNGEIYEKYMEIYGNIWKSSKYIEIQLI